MSLANENQQNQEPSERNQSSVNNSSETKISLNTMDSMKGIGMEEMTTLKKLCPTKQAGEACSLC